MSEHTISFTVQLLYCKYCTVPGVLPRAHTPVDIGESVLLFIFLYVGVKATQDVRVCLLLDGSE